MEIIFTNADALLNQISKASRAMSADIHATFAVTIATLALKPWDYINPWSRRMHTLKTVREISKKTNKVFRAETLALAEMVKYQLNQCPFDPYIPPESMKGDANAN